MRLKLGKKRIEGLEGKKADITNRTTMQSTTAKPTQKGM